MKFITRDTDYAIRALVFMAEALKSGNGKIVTVERIIAEEKLPNRFLRCILQKLAKNKILFSCKGKAGGFSFRKSPSNITVNDVIKIFQGKVDLTNCFLRGRGCPNRSECSVRKKIRSINMKVVKELDSITIEELSK